MKRSMMFFAALAFFAVIGCQKEKETPAEPNPDYDPETNTVKTEFVLSVSTSTGKDTKTSADYSQVNGSFLGMEAVHLLAYELPYKSTDKGYFFYKPVHSGQAVATKRDFNIGTLMKAGEVTTEKASRSVELALPLGTNCIALYGKAPKIASNDEQGCTLMDGIAGDLTTSKFSLKQRLTSQAAFDAGAFVYSRTINYFIAAGLVNEATFWKNPTGTSNKSYSFWFPIPGDDVVASLPSSPKDGDVATGSDAVEYTYYTGELAWKQLGRIYDYANDDMASTDPEKVVYTKDKKNHFTLSPLGEVLGEAYSRLTTIKASSDGKYKELRAGSAPATLHTMHDLYTIVDKVVNAVPTSWEEYAVKCLGEEIATRMLKFFTVDSSGDLDYLRTASGSIDLQTLLGNLVAACSPNDWTAYHDRVLGNFDVSYFYDIDNGYYGFPVNVDLPYGAAIMMCDVKPDEDGKMHLDSFSYTTDIPAYGLGDASFPIANYRYEPELMYWGNSPIRVSDQAMKSSQYPPTISAWNTASWWQDWEERASVKSTTRSVAMENNINYGTALLASTIKFADGITALKDNNAALHNGEEDNIIPLSDVNFLVTGIIISGQPDVVGWDFTRYPDYGAYAGMSYNSTTGHFDNAVYANNPFDKMIYTRVMNPIDIGSRSNIAYTFAWDNYDATKGPDEQQDVYIGLEILNQGEEFWGEMNLIRKQGVFYLLGKLDLSDAIETARQNNSEAFKDLNRDHYCYPPFDPASGKTINVPRVFMQDYMTTADLVIGTDALKHAYVTVPDLRTGQVSLGVSIDMSWTPGLAFNVIMGGVND